MKKAAFVLAFLLVATLFGSALADEWTCPACGSAASGNFCSTCGGKKPPEVSNEWICPACGHNAKDNYCSMCGRPRPAAGSSVRLEKMEIFQDKADNIYRDKYLTDNYKNQYSHSMSIDRGSLTYLVNYEYLTFSGTVAFPKGLSCDVYKKSATLKIYGDGDLLAEFNEVNDGSRPQAFSIDIADYERVKLVWSSNGTNSNSWSNWGYFATIFDGTLTPAY